MGYQLVFQFSDTHFTSNISLRHANGRFRVTTTRMMLRIIVERHDVDACCMR